MANNYTQFSAVLNVGSKENVDKVTSLFKAYSLEMEQDENYGWAGFDLQKYEGAEQNAVWINSGEESGSPDNVLDFVGRVGKELKLSGVWGFTWASTCSKLRIDEFDGGAACINLKNGRVEYVNSAAWLEKKLRSRKAA